MTACVRPCWGIVLSQLTALQQDHNPLRCLAIGRISRSETSRRVGADRPYLACWGWRAMAGTRFQPCLPAVRPAAQTQNRAPCDPLIEEPTRAGMVSPWTLCSARATVRVFSPSTRSSTTGIPNGCRLGPYSGAAGTLRKLSPSTTRHARTR